MSQILNFFERAGWGREKEERKRGKEEKKGWEKEGEEKGENRRVDKERGRKEGKEKGEKRRGIYTPKFCKNCQFWDLCPQPCTDGDEI